MARSFLKYLAAMGADRVRLLQDFLSVTKLTLNFEYESPAHQHIVFLDEERQVLIGCSGIHAPGKNLHPIFSYSIGRLFGFPSVLDNLTTYPRGELDAVCEEIASGWNTEGSVLVLLDENYLVLDLVKVKARWYVLLRAIREKIRRGVRDSVQRNQVVRAIDLRLHTLQRDMGMPEPFVNRFIALGARFADYLGKETTADPAEIIANYPVFWRRFLQAQQLPLGAELMAADSITYDATAFKKDDLPLLVFAQGIPGCGKSLVAVRTVEYLRSQGVSAVQLAQDDFAHLGQKQSGQACFDAVQTLLLEKQHRVVILARNNANKQQFGRYLQFDDYLCRTLFFCPAELSGDRLAEMVYMSVAAVLHRKQSDEPHPTDEMSEGSLAVLPLRFLAMLKIDRGAIRPEFLRPGPLPVPAVGLMNAQIKSAHANLKKMSDRDMAELRLDDAEHVKSVLTDFHRPADDVARDLGDALIRLLRYDVPPFGSYVCALLRPLSTEAALALIPPSVPASWTRHCHHMTLFHSSSFVARPDDWTNSLKQLGRDVQLRVAAVLADDRVCLAVVEPIDFDLTVVASGQPHITLATAPGVGPVASLDLLAAWAAGAAHVVVVPLPAEPLLLDSIVQLETQEAHDEVHDVDDSK